MGHDAKTSDLLAGIAPGVYRISNSAYHAGAGVSKSQLDILARSPAHYQHALTAPRTQTTAFSIGSEAHRLILEPDERSDALLKPSLQRRSKGDREEWAAFFTEHGADGAAIIERPAAEWDAIFHAVTGRYLLDREDFEKVVAMRDAVYSHPSASELLSVGVAEQSAYWHDRETGLLCRCRPDWVHDESVIVDLKSSDDASPRSFARSVAKWRYHVQDPYYTDGWQAATGADYPLPFVFVVVEKSPPHAVGVYILDEETQFAGRSAYRQNLATLAECQAADKWPAYSADVETISAPLWAIKTED